MLFVLASPVFNEVPGDVVFQAYHDVSIAPSSGAIAPMLRSSSIAGSDCIRTDAASADAACIIHVM